MFLNPFYLFSISWISVLVLYNLQIAKIFPKLTVELFNLLIFSIFFSVALGLIYNKYIAKKKRKMKVNKSYKKIYFIIILLFVIDFIYEGKIPLIETLVRSGYGYSDFKGIPTFHVLLFTYNFYITLCCFNDYQLTRRKMYLRCSIIGFIPYILLYQRGSTLILLFLFLLIRLYYKYKIKFLIKTICLGIVVLYLFGIAGNIRHYYKWNDSSMIKRIAKIETVKSFVDPLLWSYVYIASPLGNLQHNLNKTIPKYNIEVFFYENFLLDAFNKRIDYNAQKPKLIVPHLTVSSFYIEAYTNYGMLGMKILLLSYMLLEILYLNFLKDTKYWIVGTCLISILNVLSIFSNMFVFSGISFTLIYPLVDIFIEKIKRRIKI